MMLTAMDLGTEQASHLDDSRRQRFGPYSVGQVEKAVIAGQRVIHWCHLISIHCGMVTQPSLEVTPQFSGASYILGVTPMVGTPPNSNAASPLSHQKPCQACWRKTLMNQISNSHHP